MPTAAKFVAAITFAFVAWFAAGLVPPYLPKGTRIGYLLELSAFIGVLMGWQISGRHAGTGVRAGLGYGLTTMAAIVFWVLLFSAGDEMLERSMNLHYDGPVQALTEAVKLFLEYGLLLAKPDILVWLICGALFGGWVTELTARNWS